MKKHVERQQLRQNILYYHLLHQNIRLYYPFKNVYQDMRKYTFT